MRIPVIFPGILLAISFTVVGATAQTKPAAPATPAPPAAPQKDPSSAFNKRMFDQIGAWILKSAEKMPEEHFAYKPTEQIRSFAEVVGHVADANYMFCALVSGEKNPMHRVEQTKSSKADVIAALKDAFAYCDKTYSAMNDVSGLQTVKLFGDDTTKTNALNVNVVHMTEHYGNLVLYMRLKNIIPPSTEQMGARPTGPQPAKKQ